MQRYINYTAFPLKDDKLYIVLYIYLYAAIHIQYMYMYTMYIINMYSTYSMCGCVSTKIFISLDYFYDIQQLAKYRICG